MFKRLIINDIKRSKFVTLTTLLIVTASSVLLSLAITLAVNFTLCKCIQVILI